MDGNFSNGKRVEEKVNTEQATINNLLEKMINMEKKSKKRIEKLMRDHKAELKRARVDNSGGSSSGRFQCGGYSGDGEREYKKPKLDWAEEKRARNRVKWEKRVEEKLVKPGP